MHYCQKRESKVSKISISCNSYLKNTVKTEIAKTKHNYNKKKYNHSRLMFDFLKFMFAHIVMMAISFWYPIFILRCYIVSNFSGTFHNAEGKVNGLILFFLAGVSVAQNPFILMNTFLMYDNEEIFFHQTMAK